MQVQEIAQLVGGEVVGDGAREITGIQKIEDAGHGDISFIANVKYAKFHGTTQASALIVGDDFETTRPDMVYVRVQDPYMAFLMALRTFAPVAPVQEPGIHPTAVIASDAEIASDVSIGAHVVIGPGCRVGEGSIIHPNAVLGAGVSIGAGCTIYASVALYYGTQIGNRVIIHAGAVLGADGFGFAPRPDGGWEKIPQIGIVVVEDDVEIGANVTIDRATIGATRIGRGVKLDNLIHIAHNVQVGENTVIAAQAGISGSTRIGTRNLIAGQVGIVGHVETAEDVIIEAQSGVSKSIRKSGRYFGHPVKEHAQALRQEGALRQLPDILRDLREMNNRIAQLEAALRVAPK